MKWAARTWAWDSEYLLNEARRVSEVVLELAAIFEAEVEAAVILAIEASSDTIWCWCCCEADMVAAEELDAWVASIFAALLDPVAISCLLDDVDDVDDVGRLLSHMANKLALRPLASTISLDLESDDKAFTSLWRCEEEENFRELLASLLVEATAAAAARVDSLLEAIWVEDEAA